MLASSSLHKTITNY